MKYTHKKPEKKLRIISLLGLLAGLFALTLTSAGAAVTFDPATGTGFVGKGDVQTVLNMNNAKIQAAAENLVFTYNTTDEYSAICTWTTGEGTRGEATHNVSHSTSTVVNDSLQYDTRKNHQNDVTGFFLTGFGTMSSTGEVPVVGGPCPGNQGTDGTWSSVDLISSSGGLFVNGVALPITPVV